MPSSGQISIWGEGGILGSEDSKCQVLAKFQLEGRGNSWIVRTQSANFWSNFNFQGGGGILW